MRPWHARILITFVALLSLAHAYKRVETVPTMATAANRFLASLSADQRSQVAFDVKDESRTFWHYIPTMDVPKNFNHPRPGLTLEEMTPDQRHLAGVLLHAGLSRDGYMKARTIMSLEEVLRVQEGDSGVRRNPLKYHFSIFGEPSEKGVWGYRVEGHHLSLHYLMADGELVAAPTFFGSNPREVRQGPRKGLRTLAEEEDLGRKLVKSLSDEQRKAAIVASEAYKDILTGADRKAVLSGQPTGLPVSKLNAGQREMVKQIVAEYASSMPAEVAAHRMQQFQDAGDAMWFAWAGPTDWEQPHYYRLQAEQFLIEYDCTQNKANHVHAVWRDFNGDFGLDLLARHYASR